MPWPVLAQRSRYALLSMGPTAILVTVRPSISRVSGGPPTRTSPVYVTLRTYTERTSVPRPCRRVGPGAGRLMMESRMKILVLAGHHVHELLPYGECADVMREAL